MNNPSKESLVAVNCRIPKSIYEEVHKLTEVTQKSVAAFVTTAIREYIAQCTQNNYTQSKTLTVDKFALELERKERKK